MEGALRRLFNALDTQKSGQILVDDIPKVLRCWGTFDISFTAAIPITIRFEDIYLSAWNVSQLGRSSLSFEAASAIENSEDHGIAHSLQLTSEAQTAPPSTQSAAVLTGPSHFPFHFLSIGITTFVDLTLFVLRVHKAFKEFANENESVQTAVGKHVNADLNEQMMSLFAGHTNNPSATQNQAISASTVGYITRSQAGKIIRSFGGWTENRQAIHVLAALFDSDSSTISPQSVMEFDEFLEAMISIRQLAAHFELQQSRSDSTSEEYSHSLIGPKEMHYILMSFGTSLSVEELELVSSRLKPDMYKNWKFAEFADFVANLSTNAAKIHSLSAKRRVEGKSRKGDAFAKLVKSVLLVDKSQTPRIVEKLNVEALKAILLKCKETGTKFEDPDFPPAKLSLDGNFSNLTAVDPWPHRPSSFVESWKRPSDISSTPSLFITNSPTSGDMDVGNLTDTWYLSALSILTMSSNSNLSGVFLAKYPQFGLYQCRFSKDGEWHVVTVDDRLPCDAQGRPAFARSRNPNEFWISILEKAYAKLHGSYAAIQVGHTREALADLTGEVAEDSPLIYSSELWNMMLLNCRENWLMGCTFVDVITPDQHVNSQQVPTNEAISIPAKSESVHGGFSRLASPLGDTTENGILKNHTYSIMRCIEVGPYKLVQLHNPWGSPAWRGKWSASSGQWNPSLLELLNFSFEDDGTIMIEFSDWCKEFSHLHTLRLPSEDSRKPWEKISISGEWRTESAGGCTNFPSWTMNDQFKFITTHDTPTTVFLSTSHKDLRIAKDSSNKSSNLIPYPSHGIIVMKSSSTLEDNHKKDKASGVDLEAISTFQNSRDNSLEFTAMPNTPYIIVPATYDPGILGPYYFRIHTKHPAKVVPLLQLRSNKTMEGSWQAIKGTNGGSITHPSWRNSPQFLLRVFQESKLRIVLVQSDTVASPMGQHGQSANSSSSNKTLAPIAFSIFKSDAQERRKLEITDLVLHPEKYIPSTSVTGERVLPVGTYNIMCAAEGPEFENTFKLQVSGSDNIALEPLREYKRIHLRDSWSTQTAGGCKNHQTWIHNPHFLFTVPPPGGSISIVVAFTEIFKETAIGCYVFNADAKNGRGSMFGKSSFTHVSSAKTFTFNPGNYILLPCTFNPGVAKEFTIEFYSDLSITNIAKMKFSSAGSKTLSSKVVTPGANTGNNPNNPSSQGDSAPSPRIVLSPRNATGNNSTQSGPSGSSSNPTSPRAGAIVWGNNNAINSDKSEISAITHEVSSTNTTAEAKRNADLAVAAIAEGLATQGMPSSIQ